MATTTGEQRPDEAPRTQRPAAPTEPEPSAADSDLDVDGVPPIVGVGASAGGLEAFAELLSHLSGDTGLAFVLIQHLDPGHDSHLQELLARDCKMPVAEVRGATRVEADHVYVIYPQYNLSVAGGVLQLTPRAKSGHNLPIDAFFQALAADQGSRACGVVLSGTGADGTLGLQAIKAAGGITFAQEPRSAKFDNMPQSAIQSGAVDFVLSPAEIAGRLMASVRALPNPDAPAQASGKAGETELTRILQMVRTLNGVDLTEYKRSTIQRRIRRRMMLAGFGSLADYRREIERNRVELSTLCESCFVIVTAFFREPGLFAELKQSVFPRLLEGRKSEDPIRIWVAGCATGEEAYSFAIALTEFLEERGTALRFEIFATDISEAAIERARTGIYSGATLANVSAGQLARFFTPVEHGYQIVEGIREECVFAHHNLGQDPPFSRLDLISCCNVLIYLGAALQRRVLASLRYALKPAGFLVLGPSESIGSSDDSMQLVEDSHKIYCMQPGASTPKPAPKEEQPVKGRAEPRGKVAEVPSGPDVQREADRLVLAELAPAGAVVDDELNIVQVRGHTAPYFELAEGAPTRSLLKLAREGLIAGLGKALRVARQSGSVATEAGFRIKTDGRLADVTIKVIPFAATPASQQRQFLVLFEDAAPRSRSAAAPARSSRGGKEIAQLRRELAATKEYLQSIVDDKATTLEELSAANEEAQASNEELETAQEELESANEELSTLNDDLKFANQASNQVNRDLTNLLETISIPLVMVGRDLRIRRFTRTMEPMLNLIGADVGRSITDLQPRIELPNLRQLLLDAMEGRDRKPRDVRDLHGHWYSLRVLPSTGTDGKTDGAVLMLVDIDAAKRGLDFAEAIVETVREPLVILDQNLQVVKANKSFYETFVATREETENRLIYDLGNGQWNIPRLRELLENVLPAHTTFRDFEVIHDFQFVGRKVMLLNGSEVFNPNAQARTILLAIEDVTERRRIEAALTTTNTELQHFAYAVTHDLQEPLRMVVNFTELLGREYAGKLGADADKYIAYSTQGALRIEALLKALLVYWEVTEGKKDSFGLIESDGALSKALQHLQPLIAQSGAVVTSDPLPTVLAEEVSLTQLFQNLISNSIKYRSAEPPAIHIWAERDGQTWRFAVRDNGVGIAPQDSERVFGMFKRLHGSDIPGTGIGLALCRKVAERQGGRIWVESEPGHGATFKFTIPCGATDLGPGHRV